MNAPGAGGRTVLVGLGNPLRGDDAIGPAVVAGVRRQRPDVRVIDGAGDALAIVAAWEGVERAIVVDAARGAAEREGNGAGTVARDASGADAGAARAAGAERVRASVPGTVHRLAGGGSLLPKALARCSSHGGGLAEAIALAEALGRRPPELVVFAVEAVSFEPGAPMTVAVAGAIEPLVARVLAELERDEHASGEAAPTRDADAPGEPVPARVAHAPGEPDHSDAERAPCTRLP